MVVLIFNPYAHFFIVTASDFFWGGGGGFFLFFFFFLVFLERTVITSILGQSCFLLFYRVSYIVKMDG